MSTPRKPKAPARRPPPRMEYRAKYDGAWYGARVALQGDSLRVMFEEYREEFDEWYEPDAADLASPRDVAALRARFRPASPVLDDARCRDLRRGQPLCVFCVLPNGECKYYDAVLDSVERAAHGTVDGEERCACRFRVRWTEGPRRDCTAEVGVGEVCCVDDSPVQDPALTEFLDRVTRSFGFCNSEEKAPQAAGATPLRVARSLGFCNGEEKASQAAGATPPLVTTSLGFCNGDEKASQATGATPPPGGEEEASQATGAASPPGVVGGSPYVILE